MFGFHPGEEYLGSGDSAYVDLMADVLRSLGALPLDHQIPPEGVRLIQSRSDGNDLLFMCNYSDEPQEVRVKAAAPSEIAPLFGLGARVDGDELAVSIAARDAGCLCGPPGAFGWPVAGAAHSEDEILIA